MKISELKQPYRRMAEYLAEKNANPHYNNNNKVLKKAFSWAHTNYPFWGKVNEGECPQITKQIKQHFPPDFDFSGNDVKPLSDFENLPVEIQERMLFEQQLQGNPKNPEIFKEDIIADKQNGGFSWVATRDGDKFWTVVVIHKQFNLFFEKYPERYPSTQCDEACYYHCTEGGKIKPKCINEKYTQLAKEGKFDELPDTCEFSEPVELEVSDCNEVFKTLDVVGKFKGKFVEKENISCVGYTFWNFAQLPTKKIDFSEFKTGDVVEVELVHNETRIGWFDFTNETHLYIRILKRKGNQICNGGSCAGTKIINKEKIKSIKKLK